MKPTTPNTLLATAALVAASSFSYAADGTWSSLTTGNWSDSARWADTIGGDSIGDIADGSGFTANFNTLNITADTTVHLDGARTLGNLTFGDTTTSSAAGWILDNNGTAANILTLAGGTPTITVNALGTGKNVTISAAIAGSAGVTKAGTGTLVLSGANTHTGTTTVNAGIVNVQNDQSAANGGWSIRGNTAVSTVNFQAGSTVAVASGRSINMGNDSANTHTLNAAGTVTNAGTLSVQAGSVLNINSGANWTQSGGMTIQPLASFSTPIVNVNTGGTFTYSGTTAISLSASSGSGAGGATLNLSGGTFITSRGFTNAAPTDASTGTANLNFSNGGTLRLSTTVATLATVTNAGEVFNVQLGTGGGKIDTNNFSTTITQGIANVSGQTGSLTKDGLGALTLSGANTYTGDTLVNNGTLSLATTGALLFRVTDSAFTDISGIGTVSLDGTMNLDVSTLTATSGSWLLVNNTTLTESYGSNFNVKFNGGASFTEAGNVWTNGNWSFDEGTGLLSLAAVPEPSVALLGGLGMLALLRRRRD